MDTSLHIVNVLNLVIFYFFVGFNICTVQYLKNTNSILFVLKVVCQLRNQFVLYPFRWISIYDVREYLLLEYIPVNSISNSSVSEKS